MSKRTKGPRTRVPDYYEQDRVIRLRFPQFRRTNWKGHKAWVGELSPDPGSTVYTILIVYRGPKSPRVHVLSPPLRSRKHVFKEGHLCIYHHKEPGARWESDSVIAMTIIPWTASWLHFHELYLETGYWLGPEVEHGSIEKKEAS